MIMTETREHIIPRTCASCLAFGIIRYRTGLMMTDGSRLIRFVVTRRRGDGEKVEWIAITGFLPWRQAGELPRLGQQLVRFQTLCRRNRSPLYEEPFAEPARGREIGFSALPRDPLKSHFERTCLFPYFQCPNSVEKSFL